MEFKSRIKILDDLSIKHGAKDNIKNFDEFCVFYNSMAITTLVYLAMEEYANQESKREKQM